ncbi:hypothetical protein LXL04_029147 [Taraxacum kok-saghyz]
MSSRKRLKSSASRAPPVNPTHMGVQFSNDTQREKFESLLTRKQLTQKFCNKTSLIDMHISTQIQRLFQNIGWENLLDAMYSSYRKPTLEFLSSVNLDHGVLQFRVMNQTYEINEDEICGIIDAPTDNAFGPNDSVPDYNPLAFWIQITGQTNYDASRARASHIIHPVLRIAHRIVASIIYPRDERSTVNSGELKLLYCMTHPSDRRPHFGAWLSHKLAIIGGQSSGTIMCGGVITMLMYSIGAFPANHDDLERLPGRPRLDIEAYIACRLFRKNSDGIAWLIGADHTPQLLINNENKYILDIAEPITDTDWLLTDVIHPAPTDESEDEDYAPPPQNTDAPSSSSSSYHDMYMNHFQTLNNNFQALDQTYSALNQNYETLNRNYSTMDERLNTYGERLDTYNTNLQSLDQRFATFESNYNNRYTQQQTQHTDLVHLITGFQNWTIGQPGFPPPPPENDHQARKRAPSGGLAVSTKSRFAKTGPIKMGQTGEVHMKIGILMWDDDEARDKIAEQSVEKRRKREISRLGSRSCTRPV